MTKHLYYTDASDQEYVIKKFRYAFIGDRLCQYMWMTPESQARYEKAYADFENLCEDFGNHNGDISDNHMDIYLPKLLKAAQELPPLAEVEKS